MGVNPGSPAEGAGIRPTTRVRFLAHFHKGIIRWHDEGGEGRDDLRNLRDVQVFEERHTGVQFPIHDKVPLVDFIGEPIGKHTGGQRQHSDAKVMVTAP